MLELDTSTASATLVSCLLCSRPTSLLNFAVDANKQQCRVQQDLEQPCGARACNSSGPPSLETTSQLASTISLFFLVNQSCLLREALVRLVLLIAIISQVLIISGDVETNPVFMSEWKV